MMRHVTINTGLNLSILNGSLSSCWMTSAPKSDSASLMSFHEPSDSCEKTTLSIDMSGFSFLSYSVGMNYS